MDYEQFKEIMTEIGQNIRYAHGEKLVELQQKIKKVTEEGLKNGLSSVNVDINLDDKLPHSALGAINPIYNFIMDD